LQLDTVDATLTFSTNSIPMFGFEPQVIGRTFSLPVKKLSKPIKGNTGVFVVVVNSITPGVLPTDLTETRKQYAQSMSGRVENSVYNALIKKGNVEDKRYRFF